MLGLIHTILGENLRIVRSLYVYPYNSVQIGRGSTNCFRDSSLEEVDTSSDNQPVLRQTVRYCKPNTQNHRLRTLLPLIVYVYDEQ